MTKATREESFFRRLTGRFLKRGRVYSRVEDPRVVSGVEGLESHPDELPHLSSPVSLSIILFFVLVYVSWGLLVFYTVGNKWPPPWNFGQMQDLPGASVYSTETGNRVLGAGPRLLESAVPQPQHVERANPPGK
ncbi:MAG: hypothetical protein C4576_26570 [Desulfobacteraceae bacterium]|nr:MAG: hypothetical protein C4576_26570 [Desulfobacteraceae bacterium]